MCLGEVRSETVRLESWSSEYLRGRRALSLLGVKLGPGILSLSLFS